MAMDDFPFRDLMRRRLQTFLTILNLAACVGMTVFFTLFGENLGGEVSFVTSGRLTEGLSVILSRFTLIVVILNSLAGALVTSFLVSVMTSERVRDIGVMKAVGCLTDRVFAYFTIELSLITLAGCVFGTVLGVAANYISVWTLNTLGFHIQPKPANTWTLIMIFFLFASLTHILGIWQIVKTIRMKPVDALSQIFPLGTTYEAGRRIPSRLGLTAKIALGSLVRRRSQTIRIVLCLSVILTLMTLSICGGIVAKETSQSYVERAIGRDVVVIAEPHVAEQYISLLSKFFEPNQSSMIDYLDEKYVVPDTLISDLGSVRGVAKTDPRLILETTIYEYPRVVIDPESPDRYFTIGDHRTCRVVAMGINSSRVVNDWLILGEKLEEKDSNTAVIGDSVGLKTFDDPLRQFFEMFDEEFRTVGVCIDPMNNGEVVYVPFSTLSKLSGENGYNLLLIETDPSNRLETLSRIEAEIEGTNLAVMDLNGILNRHITFVDYAWSTALPLSVSSLVNAVFCLLGYMMLSLMSQRRDLGIMRALGAKPNTVMKIIFLEALFLVSVGAVAGVPLGLAITFVFFIPEATVSQASVLPIAASILLVLGAVSTSSIYPALKVTRETVDKAMS